MAIPDPLGITTEQREQLERLIEELIRWNRKINLTSVDTDEMWEKHVIDSVIVQKWIGVNQHVLDMGSGAGFPGLPLAVVRDDLTITSVDSSGKKINFQKHIKRHLGLKNFNPVHSRVEQLSEKINTLGVDVVIARAFTSLENLINYAWPFIGLKGTLLAMKGPEGDAELEQVSPDLLKKGFESVSIKNYRLPISLAERRLFMVKKTFDH